MVTTTRSRVSEGIDGKDAVGLYLEGIAKTPLLSAEEEVELAKTIELGLYAEHILNGTITQAERGKRAKRTLPRSRWVHCGHRGGKGFAAGKRGHGACTGGMCWVPMRLRNTQYVQPW